MKLEYVYIDGYKNLNDFELEFADGSTVNAVIGNNGSGKSNLIEALTQIFAALYNNLNVQFAYELYYSVYDAEIHISNIDGRFAFKKDDKTVPVGKRRTYLPRNIFLYYCGETDRLKNYSLSCVDKAFENSVKKQNEPVIKYASFVGLREFPIVLLANAAYKNMTFDKVCTLIGIENVGGTILFKLKRPDWSKKAAITEDSFWNATGAVAGVLHQLKGIGELKILDRDTAEITIESLHDLRLDSENAFDLFVKFELLMQAGILSNIEFEIIKEGITISPDQLSEGEKQMAQLLCLLETTKEHRALFFLDEFDSFLHPNWQRRFAQIISEIDIRGQLLFTTHSPLTLSKVQKENIFILKNGEVFEVAMDTFNRDVSEILGEVLEVENRPRDVNEIISNFKKSIYGKKLEEARQYYNELKDYLGETDPFWTGAEIMLKRLENSK